MYWGQALLRVAVVPLLLKNHSWGGRIQMCKLAAKPKGMIIDI